MADNCVDKFFQQGEMLQKAMNSTGKKFCDLTDQILKSGYEILEECVDSKLCSGTLVNMTSAAFQRFQLSDDQDEEIKWLKEADGYCSRSLQYNGMNQEALKMQMIIDIYKYDFHSALQHLGSMSAFGFGKAFLDIDASFQCVMRRMSERINPDMVREDFSAFATAYLGKTKELLPEEIYAGAALSIANIYQMVFGEYIDAYMLLKDVVRSPSENSFYAPIYLQLAEICSIAWLSNDFKTQNREAMIFAELALKYAETNESRAAALSVLGIAQVRNGIFEGEKKCYEATQIYSSDIVYHNYARCLFELKKYQEAEVWANKALLEIDDEMNYLLMADVCRETRQYDRAEKYYSKAIAAIRIGKNYYDYEAQDGKINRSYAPQNAMNKFLQEALKGIIRTYMYKSDLVSARSHLDAAKFLVDDADWSLFDEVLDHISVSEEEVNRAKEEIAAIREQAIKQRQLSESLIRDLIKAQDESADLDLDNAEDWNTFENRVKGIIRQMEAQAQSNKTLLSEKRNWVKKTYPNLFEAPAQFLATAEVLFEIHRDTEIDFACIVLEYCKVLEAQLRKLLGNRIPPDIKMLGELLNTIRVGNYQPYSRFVDKMNKINKFRRKAAHTGCLKQEDAEILKSILFDQGVLKMLK